MTEPGGAARGSRVMYVAYRGAAAIAQGLPDPVGRGIARGAARVKALFAVNERKRVLRNQARVRGPLRGWEAWRAVFDTYDSYGRYWQELFRLGMTSAAPSPWGW